jgi:hypothetical protein
MPSKKTKDTLGHLTRWLREIGNDTADLTVVRKECIARREAAYREIGALIDAERLATNLLSIGCP